MQEHVEELGTERHHAACVYGKAKSGVAQRLGSNDESQPPPPPLPLSLHSQHTTAIKLQPSDWSEL